MGKNGRSGRGSSDNLVQNALFAIISNLSDFDETLRKCSWYEKNEDCTKTGEI